jgi:hypothetical protein
MIGRVVLAAAILWMASCASRTLAPRCGFVDFQAAPYDHLIEQLPPVTLPELAGRLKVDPDQITGGWPKGLDARIELHGPDGLEEFITPSDDGTFVRPGLEPGSYCFKLSASGFRSMLGTVVIDRRLRQAAPFEIELMISE